MNEKINVIMKEHRNKWKYGKVSRFDSQSIYYYKLLMLFLINTKTSIVSSLSLLLNLLHRYAAEENIRSASAEVGGMMCRAFDKFLLKDFLFSLSVQRLLTHTLEELIVVRFLGNSLEDL